MKAILMSIKPKYVSLILNGIKTIEIRKRFPSNYVGWVYIYCTKDNKNNLYWTNKWITIPQIAELPSIRNGKVVARFWCDKVDDYVNGRKWLWKVGAPMWGACNDYEYILKDACLTDDELRNYVDDLAFYAIHISNLEVFDFPKELCELKQKWYCKSLKEYLLHPIGKVPQSWMYVEI